MSPQIGTAYFLGARFDLALGAVKEGKFSAPKIPQEAVDLAHSISSKAEGVVTAVHREL